MLVPLGKGGDGQNELKAACKAAFYDSEGYEKKVITIGMKDYEVRAIEGLSGENIPVF